MVLLQLGIYCLNVQMGMDYARNTHQELIMVQLHLENLAYDHVNLVL